MAIVVGQWRMLSHNDIVSHTPIIDWKKADNSCERWLVASSHLFCLNWNLLFWLTHGQTPRIGMGSSHFLSEKRTRTPSEKKTFKSLGFHLHFQLCKSKCKLCLVGTVSLQLAKHSYGTPSIFTSFPGPFRGPSGQAAVLPSTLQGWKVACGLQHAGGARWCPVRDLGAVLALLE